jgi:hypothetical protein
MSTAWGMYEIIAVIIVSNIAVLWALRAVFLGLTNTIEEFTEQVKQIDLSSNFEMTADAMEVQLQAQKQGQIFEFLKSLVQPQIQVSEIQPRDEKGQFT